MDRLDVPGADPRLRLLVRRLGVEEGSRRYLEELRWPAGVVCPRCESERVGYIQSRRKYHCRDCRYQFRCTAGTVLHDSHLSIPKWLLAVGLMVGSDDGFPAHRLQQVIGGSYKTAWFVEHRIRAAMANALLDKRAPIAEAYARKAPVEHLDGPSGLPQPDPAPAPVRGGLELLSKVAGGAYNVRSTQYLSAYWAEARWRARHSGETSAFRNTVASLLGAEPLRYEQLTRRR
jgi:transposase-like protein